MNTDAIKKNLGMTIFLVVLIGALAFVGWRLKGAVAQQREIARDLEAEQQQLSGLQRLPVYPSAENVERLEENRKRLEELFGSLHHAAYRPVEVPSVDRVQFAGLLGQKLSELNREARQSEARVKLPEKFAFGFEAYLGVLPPDALVPELTKQLVVVSEITKLMFESRVNSIAVVKRPAIGAGGKSAMTATGATGDDKDKIYQQLTFDFTFSCDTPALQKFINKLSQSDWLFVIRSLTVQVRTETINVSVARAPEVRKPRRQAPPPSDRMLMPELPGRVGQVPHPPLPFPPAKPAFQNDPTATASPDSPMDTRVVEKDMLDVTIRLDLIEFPAEPKAAAQAQR